MFRRLIDWLRRFMWGRYGTDQLNSFLMVTAVILCVISWILCKISVFGVYVTGLVLEVVAWVVLALVIFRMLSKKLDVRRRENQRFLNRTAAIRDRQNRYFRCPQCGQTVRVPRGRGKICIKCPKCSEKFIRKT